VGAVELGKPTGLEALTALLQTLHVPSSEIEIACRVLTTEPHYEIPNVTVTPETFRRLGL
jgi:hypothetical protein